MLNKMDYHGTALGKKCMLLLSVISLAMALAACGNTGITGEGKGQAEQPTAPMEPVKLVFYSTAGWSQEAFNERFGDAMSKKFSKDTIEYVASGKGMTLDDLITAGAQIDVFWQSVDNTIPQMLPYNLQYDMTDLIKKHQVDLSRLEPSSINAVKEMSDGKMYALPLVNNTAALYYNKDLFDKFAVPYPKEGMTWDQVIELAKRMHRTDGGQPYYGIGDSITIHASMSSLSIPYVDPKTLKPTILTNEGWKTIFNELVAMKLTTDNKTMRENEFVKNKNLAMVDALANLFLNKDMTSMNWDIVSYPTYKEKPDLGSQALPTLFGITSISKHKDEAMEVLKYMLSEEVQKSLSERAVIPILQDKAVLGAFASKSSYQGKNFQAILAKKFAPINAKSKYEVKARGIYDKQLSELAEGKVDMNTAFREIDEEVNALIMEDKAK